MRPLLAKLLGDANAEVRAQAAKGLGDVKLAGARGPLEQRLTDSEPRVQFFAAQSLGKLGNAVSAEPLLALLRANDNKDQYLRFAAANALSKLGADAALAKAAGIRPRPYDWAYCWPIATRPIPRSPASCRTAMRSSCARRPRPSTTRPSRWGWRRWPASWPVPRPPMRRWWCVR